MASSSAASEGPSAWGGVGEPGQCRSPVVGVPQGGLGAVTAAGSLDQCANEAFNRVQKGRLLLRGQTHAAFLEISQGTQNVVSRPPDT